MLTSPLKEASLLLRCPIIGAGERGVFKQPLNGGCKGGRVPKIGYPQIEPLFDEVFIMRDSRLDRLAAVLVQYSTGVKKGDLVRIGGEVPGLPLMEAVYEQVLLAGGHPFLHV